MAGNRAVEDRIRGGNLQRAGRPLGLALSLAALLAGVGLRRTEHDDLQG